jgi:hypothetical protein
VKSPKLPFVSKLDRLDVPIKDDLDNPLPSHGPEHIFPDKYGPYKELADDPRWERITPRMCLTHSTGFSNFRFLEPDQKLHIHFEPGTHFSYAGEGFLLLQFVVDMGARPKGWGLMSAILSNDGRSEAVSPNWSGLFSATPACLMTGIWKPSRKVMSSRRPCWKSARQFPDEGQVEVIAPSDRPRVSKVELTAANRPQTSVFSKVLLTFSYWDLWRTKYPTSTDVNS